MSLQIIDYIFFAAVIIGLIIGLVKGFLSRLIALGGLVLGIIVAGKFSTLVSGWLVSVIEKDSTRNLVAYIVCILATIIVVAIIGKLLKNLVTSVKLLNSLDKLLGAVLSIGIVYVIFAFVFAVVKIETEITILQYVLDAIKAFVPDDAFTATLLGENVVGNWLINMLGLVK